MLRRCHALRAGACGTGGRSSPLLEAAPSRFNSVSQRLRGGGAQADAASPPARPRRAHRRRPQPASPAPRTPGAGYGVQAQGVAAQAGASAAALPYQGPLLEVMRLLRDKNPRQAWPPREPAAGTSGRCPAMSPSEEALEALGQLAEAARVYGSIVDLFPGRADLRRFAGERRSAGYRRTPAGCRYLPQGARAAPGPPPATACSALLLRADAGRRRSRVDFGAGPRHPPERFPGIPRASLQGTWSSSPPPGCAMPRARGPGSAPASAPPAQADRPSRPCASCSTGETDASDVDFPHPRQPGRLHAYYRSRSLPSGGSSGRRPPATAGVLHHPRHSQRPIPYRVGRAHYYSRGPMGYEGWASWKSSSTTAAAPCASPSARLWPAPSSTSARFAAPLVD